MKTIESRIADEVIGNPALGPDNKIYVHADKAIEIATEHAQSLAKDVIAELEATEYLNGEDVSASMKYAITLIRSKFNINQ